MVVLGEKVCACCGGDGGGKKLLRCAGCRSVWYCGQACQKKHWAKHRDECRKQQAERKKASSHAAQQQVAPQQRRQAPPTASQRPQDQQPMPQSALRAASRTASCSNPKNEKKKKGKQPQAQRRLPAELAKKVKPPPVPKCAASIFRHHHVIKAYRPASPSTGGTRPSPQQQQQQQHHQQQQPVFNVLILLHDGEGTEQEMATLAARMQLSHFHCISVAADSLQDDPLQPTESHPQDSREPLLFVDDGPWFGTRQQQPGKVTVLQSCTQRLLRLVDSLVTQGYSPKGIFLLGIGQGGMAACQCALSLVRQHLHNGTRGSDAPKQTTENDGGGDGSAVGVRKVLGGVVVVNGPCLHPLIAHARVDGSDKPTTASSSSSSLAMCGSLAPPILVTHAKPDPHLPAARVVRDVHALRQQWGADVTLTETPEAAVLSPTAMRAIFGFLGQHMRTVLQHLADAGELVHVAS